MSCLYSHCPKDRDGYTPSSLWPANLSKLRSSDKSESVPQNKRVVCWSVSVNLIQTRATREERASRYPHQIGLWTHLCNMLLINDGDEQAQPTMGSSIPRQEVLDYMRKQASRKVYSSELPSRMGSNGCVSQLTLYSTRCFWL